jgi:hypothetical protein
MPLQDLPRLEGYFHLYVLPCTSTTHAQLLACFIPRSAFDAGMAVWAGIGNTAVEFYTGKASQVQLIYCYSLIAWGDEDWIYFTKCITYKVMVSYFCS